MAKRGWGERLKERARELGLADSAVARAVGLTQRRYSSYSNETRTPDYGMLMRICTVLKTSPDEVLGFAPGRPATLSDGQASRVDAALAALEGTDAERAIAVLETMAAHPSVSVSSSASKNAGRKATTGPRKTATVP